MKTSSAGIELIKKFEGVKLRAYLDSVNIPTIGVGHIKGVKMGDVITMEQADAFLANDLKAAESAINNCVKVLLEQHQFDALASWTFNLGGGALAGSTMLKCLNAKQFDQAADEMLKWNKAGGRVIPGLVKRRIAERMLFLTGEA